LDGLVPTVAEPRIDELINDASVVAVNLESLAALCPKSAALCLESLALNTRAIDRSSIDSAAFEYVVGSRERRASQTVER
jgi:hypothetical protein